MGAGNSESEILLKVVADSTQIAKLTQGFTATINVVQDAGKEAEKLGLMLKQATELGDIKGLIGAMALLQQTNAKVAAEERAQAEQRRKIEAERRQASQTAAEERRKAAAETAAANKKARDDATALKEAEKKAADEAKRLADEAKKVADRFEEAEKKSDALWTSFKRGAAFAAGMAAAKAAKDAVVDFFKSSVVEGVQFNATLETSALGIASVLKTFNPEKYATFNSAVKESGTLIDDLKKKALESPATFESLLQAYQGTAGAMAAANIPLKRQVDLITNISQSMVALGIATQEMRQEATALLEGRIDRNSRLANTLGISAEDIRIAKEAGTLYEFLTERMKEFAVAGQVGAMSVAVLESNLKDARTQQAAESTKELTESYRELLISMTALVKSDTFSDLVKWLAAVAGLAAEAAKGISSVAAGRQGDGSLVADRRTDVKNFRDAAQSVQGPEDVQRAKAIGTQTMGRIMFAFSNAWKTPGTDGQITKTQLAALVAETKAQLDELENRSTELIAKNRAESAAAKASLDERKGRAVLAEIVKDAKQSADEHERAQRAIKASTGTSEEMLKALTDNEASVKRQYDLLRENLRYAKDDVQFAEVSAELQRQETTELSKIGKARAIIYERLSQQEFDLQQEKARSGTISEQIAAKEALIARVKGDTTKDQMVKDREVFAIQRDITGLRTKATQQELDYQQEKARTGTVEEQIGAKLRLIDAIRADTQKEEVVRLKEIAGIHREISAIKDRERAKELQAASEEQQRQINANRKGISESPYLTRKQKDALLNESYRQERATLPAQIAAADDRANTATRDSAVQAQAQGEARRLRDRQLEVGGDIAATDPTTLAQDWQAATVALQDNFATVASTITDVLQSAVDGIAESITGLIQGTMTWGDALRNIGGSILNGVIGGFAKMFAQWIVGRLTMSAVAQTASVKEGAVDAAAKAPGALMSSISSWGVAAAVGVAALVAAMAMFDVGGYTAKGPKDKPAGVVHAGEWVAPKWMVESKEAGPLIQMLESSRQGGPGYSLGGFVKDALVYAGMPKWSIPKAMRAPLEKYNPIFGTAITGQAEAAGTISDTRSQAYKDYLDGVTVPSSISAAGGGVGSSIATGSTNGPGAAGSGPAVNMAFFNTRQDAEQWLSSQKGRRTMIDFLREQQYEL